MPVLGRSNHAFFFDGVSDSIVVPQGSMSRLGIDTSDGTKNKANILGERQNIQNEGALSGILNTQICIEAWIVPDCGGVVVEKEDQFKLSVGEVDTPGPATFEVFLDTDSGKEHHFLSTATKVTSRGYEGTVYPPVEFGGIHGSYNKYNGSYDDVTTLNADQRPLIHVVATVRQGAIELYINGELMARKKLPNQIVKISKGNAHIYVGGRGGEFRGVMESLHISGYFDEGAIERSAPIANDNTLLLYRFEEPIAPIEDVYTFSSIADSTVTLDGSSVTLSQITVSTTDAVKLAKQLTGLSTVSGTYTFSKDSTHNYSGGDYKVVDYQQTPGTPTIHAISHTPYNLLINAGAVDRDIFKPNNKPPERVRLHNINTSTGTMLVSSVHLDFPNSANGLRNALHSRTAGLDNYFVVVGADLLIDNASGKPYQPPHYSTQMVDRTGQMVIDESPFGLHGFVYSSKMATDTSENAFGVTWPTDVDDGFKIGHSGRHALNHVDGHDFLKLMPRAQDEVVDQQIDGSADIIDIIYDASKSGISDQISINSRVDVYREQDVLSVRAVTNKSEVDVLFDNGLVDAQKEVLAIGGSNFDYKPFMLKGPVPEDLSNINTETRRLHLRPSEKSRVALLRVPALSSYDMAPFVKIHYNAVDLTGASMSGVTQPLLMVEKTVPAGTKVLTGNTTVFSLIKAAIETNTIRSELFAPGGYIDLNVDDNTLIGTLLESHTLVGDVSEGYESDDELDESLTPINYKPMTPTGITSNGALTAGAGTTITTNGTSSDSTLIAEGDDLYNSNLAFVGTIASGGIGANITITANNVAALTDDEELFIGVGTNVYPNTTPQIITASHSPSTTHDSVFNKIVIEPNATSKNKDLTDKGTYFRKEPSTVIDSPSNGEFDIGGTLSATHIHEMFDIIDNQYLPNGSLRLYVQPSDRRRINQLDTMRTQVTHNKEPNQISIMYLMSRARIRAMLDSNNEGESYTTVRCIGLTESTVNRGVSVRGKGSPDSQVVKEIEPNAPVVTVTLGGPGQGAMDTKPTFDPSPLARLPFSTRRNTATLANLATASSGGGALGVKPLNNNSTDLASWGTYGFPDAGRVYLQDGSSAKYDSKDGTSFTFTDASNAGDAKFLLANGTEFTVFADWLSATDIANDITGTSVVGVSVTLFADPFFDESSLAEDGTTLNDTMTLREGSSPAQTTRSRFT